MEVLVCTQNVEAKLDAIEARSMSLPEPLATLRDRILSAAIWHGHRDALGVGMCNHGKQAELVMEPRRWLPKRWSLA